jgi:CRISPR system Cascade subunit CasE
MSTLVFTRARLKSDSSVAALAPILFPGDHSSLPPHTGKALVWSLFADGAARERDFLWRWDGRKPGRLGGEFLILSERTPDNSHNLFDLESKVYDPELVAGDRLAFQLRANAVIRKRAPGQTHSAKHDVVMNALSALEHESRASERPAIISNAGAAWVKRQVEAAGASLEPSEVLVDGYDQHEVSRGEKTSPLRFSSLEFAGILTVTDPVKLRQAIEKGFGASKAYGCGLMLIRRA